MARIIVLDSGDLGLACGKPGNPVAGDFRWLVATENVADLSRYVGDRARSWVAISEEGKSAGEP